MPIMIMTTNSDCDKCGASGDEEGNYNNDGDDGGHGLYEKMVIIGSLTIRIDSYRSQSNLIDSH